MTYAPKLSRDDGRIDWSKAAVAIERQVRAFDPWPGTFTTLNGATLKVLGVAFADGVGPAGLTLDDRLTIGCGEGALRLARVQAPGKPPMEARAFLNGHKVPAGTVLG
jgi:methionyl-tRNA formyltransferase